MSGVQYPLDGKQVLRHDTTGIIGSYGQQLRERLSRERPRWINPKTRAGGKNLNQNSTSSSQGEMEKMIASYQLKPIQRFTTMTQTISVLNNNCTIIPFVIMAFRRVEYLQQLLESLRASDFPYQSVPIIISHDGRVPEMIQYVESLNKTTSTTTPQFQIVQLIHPFSCYEHAHSFPGNDPKLNVGFHGDTYGNPRSEWATCCKHHFTWMINTVFGLEQFRQVDTFFFLEEDYIVARNIYASIRMGLNVMVYTEPNTTNGYFGLVANSRPPVSLYSRDSVKNLPLTFDWIVDTFRTGPMTMNRFVFNLLRNHSKEYCTSYDEYNWDWTLYHLMRDQLLPSTVLVPHRFPLVYHIGVSGMHSSEHTKLSELYLVPRQEDLERQKQLLLRTTSLNEHHGKRWSLFSSLFTATATNMTVGNMILPPPRFHKPSGGWGHPTDQQHCLNLFQEGMTNN